jgi:hypothetical protein
MTLNKLNAALAGMFVAGAVFFTICSTELSSRREVEQLKAA